ncbi:hypothetical protein HMPREF0868_1073 [Mageeibacillus indolicus UPII9-5]|uniref:Sulfate exporter family transporter n=2 Tax=Bacillota TaxID=1239 RepID=D3R2F6_MAGIU|nr:putative sulfate exporter family transporter [Mageeibacillus indolicus]ADC91025.1 hypothetical protein HMPREF0868_1073 [Mageeibacillus indolicus UPII9-5]
MIKSIEKNIKGIILCLVIAIISQIIGKKIPLVGPAVFGILIGMALNQIIKDKKSYMDGLRFTSKKILQYAVILLGFGLDLGIVLKTGRQSLPIILSTISTSLIIAYLAYKAGLIKGNIATLVGVGSSICGGSAIAAAAPVIDADEDEIAQAISVIFFFNILAAILFPSLGRIIGFSTTDGHAFGIFAGSAVNDTSSVTACASTWDTIFNLGSQTLDKAVTVKLARTLAIIPICLGLAFIRMRNAEQEANKKISIIQIFPFFIIYFILASLITTIALAKGVDIGFFKPFKDLSKFFIVMAMSAIGFNSDIVKLLKSGAKPLALGGVCFISITSITLILEKVLGIL